MLAAGRLTQYVALEQPTPLPPGDYGMVEQLWAEVAHVWAEVVPIAAREYFAAGGAHSDVTHRVTIRPRADVKTTWRIVNGTAVYAISAVREPSADEMEILCVEQT